MVLYFVDGGVSRGIRMAKVNVCLLRSISMLVVLVKMKRPAVRVMPNEKRRKKADMTVTAITQPSTWISLASSCWVRL